MTTETATGTAATSEPPALGEAHLAFLSEHPALGHQQRVKSASEHGRARMERLGEIDSASEDVLIDVVRKLEEQLWMIRAQFEIS